MRKLLKRFAAAASAVVIGGVTCVTTWFSVPVSAAAGVGWLEWLEFQTLLQGIGVGGNNSDFADSVQTWIDGIGGPEMPREDYDGKWMTNYEYYNRLGWDEIIDWFDGLFSGDNSYSDVADVGADVSSVGLSGLSWVVSCNGMALFDYSSQPSDTWMYPSVPGFGRESYSHKLSDKVFVVFSYNDSYYLYYVNADGGLSGGSVSRYSLCFATRSDGTGTLGFGDPSIITPKGYDRAISDVADFSILYPTYQSVIDVMSSLGVIYNGFSSASDAISWFKSNYKSSDWVSVYNPDSDFVGPVYTYPAAQELYKSTGTAAGIRLDVQTQDGVPDVQAALDGAGVKTVDDLVAGVAAGTVPMSKVFADAKVTPYVVADTTSGTVVTDLGVSATAAGVKSVGLTQDLAVPKDLSAAATYSIKGKTWDPEMSKYKLPLFEYFPFCLPWDIYQVLAAFSADPVAPVFDVPVGKILSGVRSVDASKAASVSAKIDFGDDNWSKVFEIIRVLECAGIIVGLCLVAVYLIHGGR